MESYNRVLISSVVFRVLLVFLQGRWKELCPLDFGVAMWLTLANDRALRARKWFAILCSFQNEQPHPLWYPLGQPESQNEHNLGQGSVDVFCKGSHSKYFRLCGPYTMSQLLNSAIVEKSRQYASKWARLSSRKTLFIETSRFACDQPLT